MGPDDFLMIVMLIALTLYAIWGGADFGGGIWEFTSVLQSTEKERGHVYRAIGPVWEANHVWLIFVLVILLNGFPLAYAALGRALWLPMLCVLCGIVFRGAGYIFRSYGQGRAREQTFWEAAFAVASTATPFFLGASAGAIASGKLAITKTGDYTANYLTGWISGETIFTGFYAVAMCAYLAAVYLAREAEQVEDDELVRIWRQRAISTGLWMGLLSTGGLLMVFIDMPELAAGFQNRGWPFVLVSLVFGFWSLYALWNSRFSRAVFTSSGAVAAVIWGWGVSQYPVLIPPHLTSEQVKAPDNVLWLMLIVISLGAILLLPALGYLLILFKAHRPDTKIPPVTQN
ncbi:MAG: cytochrome d ubiquinol oxidase subunit II [Planctomycetaceae bacterium]|nr:cytochrome d ubiquinol oxidase subunit II [Planctomycetaceae bacterium]